MTSLTFDDILGLEEKFYDDGYRQGLSDGIEAGRIEGRTFGLERGFQRYVESGRLYGKALIWANRTPQLQKLTIPDRQQGLPWKLSQLSDNTRLFRHIKTLHALAESESLSTENTDEAVSDFDDRQKRAQAKAKMIERMVGEAKGNSEGQGKGTSDGSIEDARVFNPRH